MRHTRLDEVGKRRATARLPLGDSERDQLRNRPLVIKATTETQDTGMAISNMRVQYEETFSATYLNSFLKNMDKNSITMRLPRKAACPRIHWG